MFFTTYENCLGRIMCIINRYKFVLPLFILWPAKILLFLIFNITIFGCNKSDQNGSQRLMKQLVLGKITSTTIGQYKIPETFVKDGKALYSQYGCIVCHGINGQGDGPIALTLNPPPRDFRDLVGYRMGSDLVTIAKTLKEGIVDNPSMPPFSHLTDEVRFKIAMYVASIQKSSVKSSLGP